MATNSSMVIRARRKMATSPTSTPIRSKSATTRIGYASSLGLTSELVRIKSRSSTWVKRSRKGEVIADGAGTVYGELALGRNVLVGFMSFEGFNFEDAIIISEELVKNDAYTSIHIEEFDIEIRETKLGREEFTRDIPNVSEKALSNLDETGIVRIGTYVRPGEVLVGKVSPKSKTELTPEEKLLARDLRSCGRRREERLTGSALRRGRHRDRYAKVLKAHEPQRRRTQGVRESAEGSRSCRQRTRSLKFHRMVSEWNPCWDER